MADTPYAYGLDCTWHDYRAMAAQRKGASGPVPCCPRCGGPVKELMSTEVFWTTVRQRSGGKPEVEAMMRWGAGRCFPDPDTLQNAYRQAVQE